MSVAGRRLRYGGPWFSEASALPVGGGLGSPQRLTRLLLTAVRRPRRGIALIGLLLRAPTVDVELSDSAAGRLVREHLGQRFLGIFPQNRLCQGVLILSQEHSDYLSGRRRRTVRTNLRRAVAVRIQCETVDCSSEALNAAWQVVHDRRAPTKADDLATLTGALPALFDRPEVTLLLARDADRNPLAVAAVVIDDQVCLIRLAVSSSHEARWALHHHLVLTLIARRVKYLVAACDGPFGALGLTHNEQYYQHLLGYDLCHMSTRSARRRKLARLLRLPEFMSDPGAPRSERVD
jgi:hypothetical protein